MLESQSSSGRKNKRRLTTVSSDQHAEHEDRDGRRVAELAVVEGGLVDHHGQRQSAGLRATERAGACPATPPSSINGASKSWMLPMMVMLTMKKLTRLSSGSVMRTSTCQSLAPSIRAASKISGGNGLEARGEQQDVPAEVLPDGHQRDGWLDPGAAAGGVPSQSTASIPTR